MELLFVIAGVVVSGITLFITIRQGIKNDVSKYPKLTAELKPSNGQILPNCSLVNESHEISACQISVTTSIAEPGKRFCFLKKKWFPYDMFTLERLKPEETYLPNLKSYDLSKWLRDRGYQKPSIEQQDENSQRLREKDISPRKSYKLKLVVTYHSSISGTGKNFKKIQREYKLLSKRRSNATDPRDEFFWILD